MALPEEPNLRTIPIAVISTTLPDNVAWVQHGNGPNLRLAYASFEPDIQYPILLSTLSNMTTEFAVEVKNSTGQTSQHETGDRMAKQLGFTLADGSWWYCIIATTQKLQTEPVDGTVKHNHQNVNMRRNRQAVGAFFLRALFDAGHDRTLSYWKDWKILDCPMALDGLLAELSVGVKWSKEENFLVVVIHNLQKRRDDLDIQQFLRDPPSHPNDFFDCPIPRMPVTTLPARTFSDKGTQTDPDLSYPPLTPMFEKSTIPAAETPTPVKYGPAYIPPHRFQKAKERGRASSINLDGTNSAPKMGEFTLPAKRRKRTAAEHAETLNRASSSESK